MNVDELRRGLTEAGRRPAIDVAEARAVVETRATRRRRRQHAFVGVSVAGLIVAVVLPIAWLRHDPGIAIRVAPPPAGTADAWTLMQGPTTGSRAATGGAIVSTGELLLLARSPEDHRGAIWYSADGISWRQADTPPTSGGILAMAASGRTVLAIGNDNPSMPFVWRSDDDGRTWSVAAHGPRLFSSVDEQTGVSSVTFADGLWIGSGWAGTDAVVWASSDGTKWKRVLDLHDANPALGGGRVDVVDKGDGTLFAYSTTAVWTSGNGTTWSPPVFAALPTGIELGVVAPGNAFAFGLDVSHDGKATPLLRRADGSSTWFVDPTFLAQFPGAVVSSVARHGILWVATGTSGRSNQPDAWLSVDGTTWRSMPPPFSPALVGFAGNRAVAVSSDLDSTDHYAALDTRAVTGQLARDSAQDASDRYACTYGTDEADFGADGLPFATGDSGNARVPGTDLATAEQALAAKKAELLADHPKVTDVTVGPGFRRAWQGETGRYKIVYVPDYALLLHVRTPGDCPRGNGFIAEFPGVPIFYTVG